MPTKCWRAANSMLVITEPNHVPPGGAFRAIHPESRVEFRHHTINGVWEKYNSHCRANNYPEATKQQVVDNICANTKANICHDSDKPTLAQQASSLVKSLSDWASTGFQISKELAQTRIAFCEACPYWSGLTGGSYLAGSCGKCGCTGVKLMLSGQSCPIGKW